MMKTTKPNRTRPKEIGMLMPAKGRQRVNNSPPQQCALCFPLKNGATEAPEAMTYGENMWPYSQKPCQKRKTDMK